MLCDDAGDAAVCRSIKNRGAAANASRRIQHLIYRHRSPEFDDSHQDHQEYRKTDGQFDHCAADAVEALANGFSVARELHGTRPLTE